MKSIPAAHLETARALLQNRRVLTAQLAMLKQKRQKAVANEEAWTNYFAERLRFHLNPERLAGLAELYRSVPEHRRRRIESAYRRFLREMIDPQHLYPGAPQPKPRTLDFASLPANARAYLLGPYLNIHQNNRFAELDLALSEPPHRIVMVQTGGPVDVELWRKQAPVFSAWLANDSMPGAWTITDHSANTVTLTHHAPLPQTIAFDRRFLIQGSLFVGIDMTTRNTVHVPFSDLPAGTYIPGVSGTGKTSALHILLRSIFSNLDLFEAVLLVDGKNGVAMHRYGRIHPKVRVFYDEPDVWQLTTDLVAAMTARNLTQRALGTDKTTTGFIALVVDELPTFILPPPKAHREAHSAFLANLQLIATKGRSAGIRMFLITQTPVNEQIPTMIRTNCQNTLAFRLPEQAHATSLFGTLDSVNDPRKLLTGQAVFAQGETGTVTRVQFPLAPLYQPERIARLR